MQSKQKQKRKAVAGKSLLNQSLLNRKIVSPEKLKILVLAGNELINQQLQFLQKCVNLIKLDLSHNYITKVPEKIGFAHLKKLEVMHLHYNKLASIESMHALYACPVLTYLTYHHNPIQNNAKYEHEIINMIFTLKLINNRIIYVEERSDCMLPERKTTIIDTELFQSWKSVENSEVYYLRVLNLHLQYIDNVWAFNNPIVILQRFWKHFLSRQEQEESVDSPVLLAVPQTKQNTRRATQNTHRNKRQLINNHPLKLFFQQWRTFSLNLKEVKRTMSKIKDKSNVIVDKSHMTLPLRQYAKWQKNKRLQQPIQSFIHHIRHVLYEKKMVKLFRTNIYLKKILFGSEHSFYQLGGIRENNRIYYNRSQQHIIENFLAIIAESFNKREAIYNKSSFQVNKQYKAIRLVDPESFSNKYALGKSRFAFCSLLWTSMKLVIVNRKKSLTKFKAGIIGIKQLSYLKNRDKVVTPVQYKKSQQIFNRLQKFSVNEYETSLWYFECTDEFVMRQLIRMIYYHNASALKFQVKKRRSQMMSLLQNYDQPFILYIEKVMKRTCAAVVIQKTWRRYLSSKSQKESIYYLMRKNRAALHIQHFYRDSLYKHRLFFSKKLYRDLGLIKSQTIIFPLDLYMNFNLIYNGKGALFKNMQITRDKDELGMKEEFYRPIFQQKIREHYHGGKKLGMQSQENEIDVYSLLHFDSQTKIIERNMRQFISFTFSSRTKAATVASLIALLSYQKWGKIYIFPLLRQNLQSWQEQIDTYLRLRVLKDKIKPFKAKNEDLYLTQQVKENGLFLFKHSERFIIKAEATGVGVEFYQKKYHNFPEKYVEKLSYAFINISGQLPISNINIEKTQKLIVKQNILTVDILNQQSSSRLNNNSMNLVRTKHEQQVNKLEQNYLNVTTIDKKRFSFFDQSDKNINFSQTQKSNPAQFIKPSFPQENKREKVKQFYKDEFVKRQAQKELKETSLAGIREKAKHERSMNITLRNLKEMQRTEQLRNKVNRVKNFKSRLSGQKRDEEQFMQQNNFVMEQQLRMIIMRNKIKETENKQEDNHFSRKHSVQKTNQRHSVQSRHSVKHRIKVEEEEISGLVAVERSTAVVGNEGSIVNVRKKTRKIRANSIGAYIRDPSFVHGVFPEEYYPIENRATSFYFPPVI